MQARATETTGSTSGVPPAQGFGVDAGGEGCILEEDVPM
jgi:hypothetical protein